MKFDIIIIGGGMVGGTLAYALSKGPWNIALIDAVGINHDDSRLIALNDSSCSLFKSLGIWPALAPHAAPIQQVHVSHRGHFGITRIDAQEVDLAALGHVIPAREINSALYTALHSANTVTLFCPATLKTLTQTNKTVTITVAATQGMTEFSADVLIGADGSHSTVRELVGISTQKINYQQNALVTITELARAHKNIAYERFNDQGAIAMLPLTGNRAAAIWTATNHQINQLMQLGDTEFLQELQRQFGYRLGRLFKIGKRAVYPLVMQTAAEYQKQNVLLVGNAAHTIHPVAAQGFNLALNEAAKIAHYFSTQKSLKGCLEHLPRDYLKQDFSLTLSHRLTTLFSTDFFPLNKARQAGMIAFDQCSPLKKYFVKCLMGKVPPAWTSA